ncbi:hypothetical protein [Thermotoga sp. SG1]|uniref:hypothetical protein n=1 Tax=Thermotoga sp. SG1 TaxID=126739 RepID=UPI000C75A5AC|nr:hypothetical protein [Thermotoga sp. SG1]PLV57457.1 hypothetical protein AS006_00825 [Thermotoga sp. SG1]
MRKWLVFISVLIAVLSFSQILNYVPTDFKAVRYVKNLSDFYGELKSLPTGRFLTETLGLEMMVQGVLESQLLSRNIEPSDFYDLFSHELLYVQLDDEDNCFILGPSSKAKSLKDSVKSLVADLFGAENVVVTEKDGYLFIGTSKAVSAALKGGRSVPEELKNLDFFNYARVHVKDYSFTIVSRKEQVEDHLTIETEVIPNDDTSRDFLEEVGQPKNISQDYYVYGELTLIFNTADYDGLMDVISGAGFNLSSEDMEMPIQLPDEKLGKVIEDLSKKLDTPMFISANISSSLMDFISGATPTNLELVAKARIKDPEAIEEALKESSVQYEKKGEEFILQNNLRLVVENGTVVLKSEQFTPKTPGEHPGEKDVFFLFLDMKAVMEALVGEGEEAYVLVRGFYDDGKMVLYVNVK